MYQPHETLWYVISFGSFLILLPVIHSILQRRHLKAPRWLFPALGLLAATQLLLAGLVRVHDERKLREELAAIPRTGVSRVTLRRDNVRRVIRDPEEISALLSLLQTVRDLPAHHSYPAENCDITIEFGGSEYQYRLGRDSAVPDEYWVFETARTGSGSSGREIGRVRSPKLGQLVGELLKKE